MTNEVKNVNLNEKNLLSLATLGAIVGFIIPLIVWAWKKDEVSAYGRRFLTATVNFELTMLIVYFIAGLIPLLNGLLVSVIFIFNLVVCIIAFSAASNHKEYKFPISFNLLK